MIKINVEEILSKKIIRFPVDDVMPNEAQIRKNVKAAIKEIVEAVVDKCEQQASIKEVKKVEKYDYADSSNYGVDSKSILQVKQQVDYE